MSTRLPSHYLIDECALEHRLVRLVQGRIAEIKLYPRVAPWSFKAQLGDRFVARIIKRGRGMNGAFVDLGASGEGFLRMANPPPEGRLVQAEVKQCAHGEKLAVLAPVSEELEGEVRQAGRMASAPGAVACALAAREPGESIEIDAEAAWQEARASAADQISLAEPGLFEREGVESQIEEALQAAAPLPCGARLIVEQTQALTTIDIDLGSGAQAGNVNQEAASEIAFQIAARRLGGAIIADFAAIRSRSELDPYTKSIQAGAAALGIELHIGAASRTGLLEIIRPRGEAPLAAALTREGFTHSALAVTLRFEASASRLARAIRLATLRRGGALTVHVSVEFADWLQKEPGRGAWQAITAACPARLAIAGGLSLVPDAFEIERVGAG